MKLSKKLKNILSTFVFIFVLLLILFILTGCQKTTSIEDYYYAIAIGIDAVDNSNNINLSIQIADTSSNSSEDMGSAQFSKYTIYQVEANSIDVAINILNNYLSKQIDLSHCSAIIFSENIARSGIITYVNTLQNNIEIRPNCNILISSSTAYDVLNKISDSGENLTARFFEHIISSAEYTGYTMSSEFNQFYTDINNDNNSAIAIYTTVSDSNIQNTGLAIFKGDTLIGTIDTEGVISHLILTNNLKSTTISITSPFNENKTIDFSLVPTKNSDIDINFVNSSPFVECNVYLSATINTIDNSSDYSSEENLKQLENSINSYLENIISNYLYTVCKEFSADTVKLGDSLAMKYSTLEEFESLNWNNIYKESFFKVTCNTKVLSSNLITKQ
jgi:spore germination protein KC